MPKRYRKLRGDTAYYPFAARTGLRARQRRHVRVLRGAGLAALALAAVLLVRQTAALHGGALLISDASEGGTIAALSFRRNLPASGAFRSPMADLDYTGCRDHGLVELSRELPRDLYDPQAIH